MKTCCLNSMTRYLKKHRDAATCDGCGHLLLAYADRRDFEETRKALTNQGTPFEVETLGPLKVIGKPRFKKK